MPAPTSLPSTLTYIDNDLAKRARRLADERRISLSELCRIGVWCFMATGQPPKGTALREGARDAKIRVRLPQQTKSLLHQFAQATDSSVSTLIARALADLLELSELPEEERGNHGAVLAAQRIAAKHLAGAQA